MKKDSQLHSLNTGLVWRITSKMLVLSHLTFYLLVVFSCWHKTQSQAFLFFPFYILWILLSALYFFSCSFSWASLSVFVCLFLLFNFHSFFWILYAQPFIVRTNLCFSSITNLHHITWFYLCIYLFIIYYTMLFASLCLRKWICLS